MREIAVVIHPISTSNHNSFDEAIWTEVPSVNGTLYDAPVIFAKT